MGQNVRRLLDGAGDCFNRRFEKKKSEEDKRKLLVGLVRGLRDIRCRQSCRTIKVIQMGGISEFSQQRNQPTLHSIPSGRHCVTQITIKASVSSNNGNTFDQPKVKPIVDVISSRPRKTYHHRPSSWVYFYKCGINRRLTRPFATTAICKHILLGTDENFWVLFL